MQVNLNPFSGHQIKIVNQTVSLAEELVSNHYKMSASQWLRPKYDVKTLVDLAAGFNQKLAGLHIACLACKFKGLF
jgi:hypothetical protein